MADNRLFLFDIITEQAIMLAKSLGDGPYKHPSKDEMSKFFSWTFEHGFDKEETIDTNDLERYFATTENDGFYIKEENLLWKKTQ